MVFSFPLLFLIVFLNNSQQNYYNYLFFNILKLSFQVTHQRLFQIVAPVHGRQNLVGPAVGAAIRDTFQDRDFGIVQAEHA